MSGFKLPTVLCAVDETGIIASITRTGERQFNHSELVHWTRVELYQERGLAVLVVIIHQRPVNRPDDVRIPTDATPPGFSGRDKSRSINGRMPGAPIIDANSS